MRMHRYWAHDCEHQNSFIYGQIHSLQIDTVAKYGGQSFDYVSTKNGDSRITRKHIVLAAVSMALVSYTCYDSYTATYAWAVCRLTSATVFTPLTNQGRRPPLSPSVPQGADARQQLSAQVCGLQLSGVDRQPHVNRHVGLFRVENG